MSSTTVFLHPGQMGVSLAAACGSDPAWVSAGRSQETRQRALDAGLREIDELAPALDQAQVVVSICPPAAAEDQAAQVAAAGYEGCYVDANAISPASTRRIGGLFERYVDGSVIGPPALNAGTTRLYLSGPEAAQVASLWDDGAVDARCLGEEVGHASALKMAYASWTKIGSALLLSICSLAEREGVSPALLAEWELSQPGLVERSSRTAAGVGPKAWRFVGEMQQIGDTFASTDLPSGFADGAAMLYEQLAELKGSHHPTLEQVLAELDAQRSDEGA